MALPITGQAQGLVLAASQKSGQPASVSTGWHNELLLTELLPRYSNLVQAGVVFEINFPAAAFAAPSATSTGAFFLFNQPNSGKNLHLIDTQVAVTTFTAIATASMAVAIIPVPNQTPTSTSSTGVTIYNALVGASNPTVAKGYVSGTLVGAPVLGQRTIASFVILTAVGAGALWQKDVIDGAVVVAPGSGIEIQSVSGTEADITGIVGLTWAELPV
jgi:hypothetical protein